MLLRLATFALSLTHQAAASFTPENLLSSPRRGSALSNEAGTLAIYRSNVYSFESHSQTSEWNLVNITSGDSSKLFPHSNARAVRWLDNDTVLFTNTSSESGDTSFWIVPQLNESNVYKATTVPGPVSDLKTVATDNAVYFVFSSLSNTNGTLHNPKKATTPHATGRVYESLFVRHWDKYLGSEKSSIFAGTLSRKGNVYTSTSDVRNLLSAGSGLETPVQPFGGASDFDISPSGELVAFVSKTPNLNPANNTQSLVYIIPFDGSRKPYALNDPDDERNPLARGASSAPKFSPDGKSIAYLQMFQNGYESDINKIYIAPMGAPSILSVAANWDVSPQNIKWSPDGKNIFTTADHVGRHKLFKVAIETGDVKVVWGKYTVTGSQLLPEGKFLLGLSSLTSSSRSFIFDPSTETLTRLQPRVKEEKSLNHDSQVEDFWFRGADGIKVHGFIVKPSFFNEKKKTKMAFFIHGGPQGAWNDGWSTRWNPTVFAEQGYIVVAVNPSGSTGYGQKFVNAIQGQWGGKPYVDLEKAMEYLQTNPKYNYIDFDKAVALGASYGGYMVNYIQGMPLGRKFKALVCHDGVFSTLNQYASEELYFPQHDFEGSLWSNRAGYERWDPARLINNWATPQMIIHGELDYRLPISEGLAAFNVLQEKGIPSKFLYFKDENHWVLKPENSLQWHTEVLEWLDRWTKDKEPEETELEYEPWAMEL